MIRTVFALFAAWSPDDRAREFAEDVSAAIDATRLPDGSRLTRKDAAFLMRLTNKNEQPNVAELSAQLSCQKPLNVFRLTALPPEFWDELYKRQAERRGGMYFTPSCVTLMRGAANLGWRTMLRMPLAEKKRFA